MSMFDEMTHKELEEALEIKDIELKDMQNALEDLEKALHNIADVDYEGADKLYDDLYELKDTLEEMITFIKMDIEEIDNCMQILEDAYDDYDERMREYRKMQGF